MSSSIGHYLQLSIYPIILLIALLYAVAKIGKCSNAGRVALALAGFLLLFVVRVSANWLGFFSGNGADPLIWGTFYPWQLFGLVANLASIFPWYLLVSAALDGRGERVATDELLELLD